jgi:NADH pyrophosphatase NudC (nudix superfamily)
MRALVADDDDVNLAIIMRMLALLGIEAEAAADGAEAVEKARAAAARSEPFEVILLDLSMPALDGLEAARLVRAAGIPSTLYALTGMDSSPEIREAGFDFVLHKPLTIDSLRQALRWRREPESAGQPLPAEAWMGAGELFRFCPSCGSGRLASDRGRRWICADCGFEYFHNVATSAGVIIDTGEGVLLLERAREPGRGKLSLPGGFVEPGERAEDAVLRECREELGWAPERLVFMATYPNLYPYKGVPYATCDLYFLAEGPKPDRLDLDIDRAESIKARYAKQESFPWEDLAFESVRLALGLYFRRHAI